MTDEQKVARVQQLIQNILKAHKCVMFPAISLEMGGKPVILKVHELINGKPVILVMPQEKALQDDKKGLSIASKNG